MQRRPGHVDVGLSFYFENISFYKIFLFKYFIIKMPDLPKFLRTDIFCSFTKAKALNQPTNYIFSAFPRLATKLQGNLSRDHCSTNLMPVMR